MSVVLFTHSSHSPRLIQRVRDEAVVQASIRYQVAFDVILGTERTRNVANARHYAMWLLRQRGYSFPEIGRAFGRPDHTGAHYGVSAHERRRSEQQQHRRAAHGG